MRLPEDAPCRLAHQVLAHQPQMLRQFGNRPKQVRWYTEQMQSQSWSFKFLLTALFSLGLAAGLPVFGEKSGAAYALPTHRVVGYLPDWTSDKRTWDWELLSDLMVFSGSLSTKTELTVSSTWKRALLDEAHAHKVSVLLSVHEFSADNIHAALTPGPVQDALVAALVKAAVTTQPGDGVDLDFEGMRAADRAALVAFVRRLRAALRAVNPAAQVALALPAVDWNQAYDIAQLATSADLLFIMGYDYHWSTSTNAGPVAPLSGGMLWSRYHLQSTVEQYKKLAGAAAKDHIVLGLPLYGFDWPTMDNKIASKTTTAATSIFYTASRAAAKTMGRKWDAESSTPWYSYQKSNVWHQVWYDDEQSLGDKMDLALSSGLAGVGFWALGYEDASLWQAVRTRFAPLSPPPPPPPADMMAPDLSLASDPKMDDSADPEATGCTMSVVSNRRPLTSPFLLAISALLLGSLSRRSRRHTTQSLRSILSPRIAR